MTVWGFADVSMALASISDADSNAMVAIAQNCHTTHWRIAVDWGKTAPSPGSRDWSSVDRVVAKLQAAGIAPTMVLGVTRPLGLNFTLNQGGVSTSAPTDFGSWVTEVAQRYGTTTGPYGVVCTEFEIWSEANNAWSWQMTVDPASYVTYLQAAYTAIKGVTGLSGSNSTVIFGGCQHIPDASGSINGWLTQREIDFVTKAYAAGAQGFFDAMAIHPYTDQEDNGVYIPSDLSNALVQNDAIRALMVTNGDGVKPIWWTEFGYSTDRFTEAQQLSYTETMFALAAERSYVQRMFLFCIRDFGPTSKYGVAQHDFTPKALLTWLETVNPIFVYGTLTGSGGFAGSGVKAYAGSGAMTGAGGFGGTGALAVTAAGTMAGVGGFAGSGLLRVAVNGTMTGSGAFGGGAALTDAVSGVLSGSGGFAGTGKLQVAVSGAVAGVGGYAGSGALQVAESGTMAGSGAFGGSGLLTVAESGAMTGSGGFSGTGTIAANTTTFPYTFPSSLN